jgi:hypothetical protein
VTFFDPDGKRVYTGRSQYGTADQVIHQMKVLLDELAKDKKVNVDDLEMNDALIWLAENLGRRFMWSKGKGFIDMRHALAATSYTNRWYLSGTDVLNEGERIELRQTYPEASFSQFESAFSVEDLVSNKVGVEFEEYLPDKVSDLPNAWRKFVDEKLGGSGTPPKVEVIEKLNEIYNLGYTPVLDPKQKDIQTTSEGIRYVSSGDKTRDHFRLKAIRQWRNTHILPFLPRMLNRLVSDLAHK